jgi:hypothetical protein
MERAERRRALAIEKVIRITGRQAHVIEDEHIIQEFGDVECASHPWSIALAWMGREYGLLNIDGKPKNRWARNVITQGQKAHRRARREELACKRRVKELHESGVLRNIESLAGSQ